MYLSNISYILSKKYNNLQTVSFHTGYLFSRSLMRFFLYPFAPQVLYAKGLLEGKVKKKWNGGWLSYLAGGHKGAPWRCPAAAAACGSAGVSATFE